MKHITTEEFLQQVVSQEANAIVEVGALWSGTCQVMRSTLAKVVNHQHQTVALYHIDSDQCQHIHALYHIHALPALLFFREGILVDKVSGLTNHHTLEEKFIQHYID